MTGPHSADSQVLGSCGSCSDAVRSKCFIYMIATRLLRMQLIHYLYIPYYKA